MAIPVIDMANLTGESRAITMAQIENGCQEWGFMQLLNHGIPTTLLDSVKRVCSENYKLIREKEFSESFPVKMLNNALVEAANNGSTEPKKLDNVDWEDVFVINYMQESYVWPSEPSDFRETMEKLGKEVYKLAEKLLELLSENLGLEKDYIKKAFAGGSGTDHKPFFGTKVSHYPPCPRPDLITGLRAHTDAGGLILLYQDDEVAGLQVLKDGHWFDVQPMPNAIVIDIGDQLEAISNGRYKSAWHRVLPNENGTRRSVASFYNPSYDAVVYPAPQLMTPKLSADKEDDHNGAESSLYPKFLFADYMSVYAHQKYLPKEPRFQAMRALY
eukprot:Gb_08184 [translate_table: standard]